MSKYRILTYFFKMFPRVFLDNVVVVVAFVVVAFVVVAFVVVAN